MREAIAGLEGKILGLSEALRWRYATKRMTGGKLAAGQLETVLDAIRLSPSSRGLQPYRIVLIEDPDLKARIRPIAEGQPQIVECSHLLVFAAWRSLSAGQVDAYIRFAAAERGIPVERLDKMKGMLVRDQLAMHREGFFQWASKQAYIALGLALTAAALHRIDATPMEGFDPEALDSLLGLPDLDLRSAVLLALGFRDAENDAFAKLGKVRRPAGELFLKAGSG